MRKLVKPWNKLPAGASVTTNPAEQVVLVDKDRLALLEKEGHLAPETRPEMQYGPGQAGAAAREIPSEVRTGAERQSVQSPAGQGGKTMVPDREAPGGVRSLRMDEARESEPIADSLKKEP